MNKSCRTIDLRLWLPLMVSLVISGLFALLLLLQYHTLITEHRESHMEQWLVTMSRLQQSLGHAFLKGDKGQGEELISSFSTDPSLLALSVVDQNDQVLLANRFEWKSKNATSVLPGLDEEKLNQTRQSNRMSNNVNLELNRLSAYYPLSLTQSSHSIRPERNGILYLYYDLEPTQKEINTVLWKNSKIVLPIAILAVVLIMFVFYFFVSRPLRLLAHATKKIAGGDFVNIPLTGKGELAELAQVFNRMSHKLSTTVADLTDREQRLDRTLESIGDGVITTDSRCCITRMNQVAENLTGWKTAEAIGQKLETVFPIINGRTREKIQNLAEIVISTGNSIELSNDTTLISKAGEEYQIVDSAAPIMGDQGHIEGVILVFHDVTDVYKTREERRIAAIAFESSDPILIANSDQQIIRVNHALCHVSGYTSDEVVGQTLDFLYARQDEGNFFEALRESLNKFGIWAGQTSHHHKDGSIRHLWESVTAVKNDSGEVTHYVINQRDITSTVQTSEALQETRDTYQSLMDSMHDGAFLLQDGLFIEVNEQLLKILKRSRDEVVGKAPVDVSPKKQPDGKSSAAKASEIISTVSSGQPLVFEWVKVDREGGLFEVEVSLKSVTVAGQPALLGTVRDISERKRTEHERLTLLEGRRIALEELKEKEELIRLATQAAGVGTWEWDLANDKVTWSDGVEAMFGLEKGAFGQSYAAYRELIYPDDLALLDSAIRLALEENKPYIAEHRVCWPDGSIHWVEAQGEVERDKDNNPLRMRGTVIDVTQRKQATEEIERLAYYDPLTGLANRRLLLDRLQQSILSTIRNKNSGALIFLDLDRFKLLNDSLGHLAGDTLLQRIANRLSSILREEDTIARLGGDEFVILLPSLVKDPLAAAQHVHRVAEKVRHTISDNYDLNGHSYHISASIGIALFPQDGNRAEVVLNHADAAMYQAKGNGRDTISYYHATLQAAADARLALEEDLRHALQKSELQLYLQPQVNDETNVVGCEALLRWFHAERGMVPPLDFIPVAEETGLILEIGEWVILTACQHLRDWSNGEYDNVPGISVNVSPVQFRHSHFVEQIERIINRCEINAELLTLEITEGTLIDDLDDTVKKLNALKVLGVKISIDDFGTGYSSLYYLKHLPLDELKIDRAYVQDITEDHNDAAIVEAILSMSRHLGLEVVAEGVETKEQADFLHKNGCTCFQGFLYSNSLPLDEFAARYLQKNESVMSE